MWSWYSLKHPVHERLQATSAPADVRALVVSPQFGGLPVPCREGASVCVLATPDAHSADVLTHRQLSVRAFVRDIFSALSVCA